MENTPHNKARRRGIIPPPGKKGVFKMTNKEVKAILSDMKKNRLFKRVINEIVSDSDNYSGNNLQERLQARLKDVGYGLSSGIVGSMIYYSDTVKFFNLYRKDIETLWQDFSFETGMKLTDLRDFDEGDPFIRDTNNKNLLAWWAYEEIAVMMENAIDE
jgi:hypothetical protein